MVSADRPRTVQAPTNKISVIVGELWYVNAWNSIVGDAVYYQTGWMVKDTEILWQPFELGSASRFASWCEADVLSAKKGASARTEEDFRL